jgi:hypothetical protein
MALLKVKGEIQELLSISKKALSEKNRIEAMVIMSDLYTSFCSADLFDINLSFIFRNEI